MSYVPPTADQAIIDKLKALTEQAEHDAFLARTRAEALRGMLNNAIHARDKALADIKAVGGSKNT